MNTTEIGKKGEELAKNFLEQKKYTIIAQNYRYKKGEIDLIAKKIEDIENEKYSEKYNETIIFVEVKLRKNNHFGFPEQSINHKKIELIKQTAIVFLENLNWQKNIRFDIIAIMPIGNEWEILHLEDCF